MFWMLCIIKSIESSPVFQRAVYTGSVVLARYGALLRVVKAFLFFNWLFSADCSVLQLLPLFLHTRSALSALYRESPNKFLGCHVKSLLTAFFRDFDYFPTVLGDSYDVFVFAFLEPH